MGNVFPPSREAALLQMSGDFAAKVTAAPADYFYSVAQASANALVTTGYADAYAAALNPATRTKAKIAAKQAARAALVTNLRMLNRLAQANPFMTDEKKIELALPVYASRVPIPIPTEIPVTKIVSTIGRTTKISLRTADSERRGRPKGVQGAIILSFLGETPPQDINLWKNEGMTTKNDFDLVFSPSVPAFSKVWIAAAWYTARALPGAVSQPIATFVGSGITSTSPSMKMAA